MHAWRFAEMAAVQAKEEHVHGGLDKNEYSLVRATGDSLILDTNDVTWMKEDEDIIAFGWTLKAARDYIKLGLFKLLLPGLLQRYEANEALTFGSVTVQKKDGLKLPGQLFSSGRHFAWDDIKDVHVSEGEFKVTGNNNQQAKIRISEIPNFELLCRLIGVDMIEMGRNMTFWKY